MPDTRVRMRGREVDADEFWDEVEWLRSFGRTDQQVARDLGVPWQTMLKALERHPEKRR